MNSNDKSIIRKMLGRMQPSSERKTGKILIAWIIIISLLFAGTAVITICHILYKTVGLYRNKVGFKSTINKKKLPQDLKIVTTGSKYSCFAFSYNNDNGIVSFANQSQDLYYDHLMLRQFSNHLAKDCIVFISLPVFIFPAQYNYLLNKYYFYLNKENIRNYNPLWKTISLLLIPLRVAISRMLVFLGVCQDPPDLNIEYSQLIEAEINTNNKAIVIANCKEFAITDMKNPFIPPDMQQRMENGVNELHEMLHFCIAQGWQPVLVSLPLHSKQNDMYSEAFLKAWLYDNIEKANDADVPYLDYRMHPDFQNKPDFFINGATLLSKAGRKHFLKLLMRDTEEAIKIHNKENTIPVLFNEKIDCCGCSACYAACKNDAIKMWQDREGFMYPYIIARKCNRCGICVSVCPIKNVKKETVKNIFIL